MIKTRYGSIVSHKFNSEYICYDSSIQPILKDRILSSIATDDYRLTNNSNFLDLNNGLIKKHFCRKGLMYIFNDNYIYNGLKKTRPVRELTNYIDFNHLIETSNNDWIINKIELCFPVFAYIKRNYLFYNGDIVLSKILGKTLDKYLMKNNRLNIEEQLGFCFGFLNALALFCVFSFRVCVVSPFPFSFLFLFFSLSFSFFLFVFQITARTAR